MKDIHTEKAPQAIGPYTQAKISGNMLFTSGQIPIDPATGELVSGGIGEQTKRVCENLKAVLEAAGTSLDKVVKTNCYLKDIGDFAAFNAVYAEYFTGKPARSCVGGLQIPKGALVEVELIAEL
ncbi:MAG: RidA family protein [Lachnospiraceae bacterium]|nr:RidA family protein [Ruminococcus sp.]MCM1276168.1 RidA family protein [Lachnospiraceae bacterium]